jgi:hypothetical protein
MNSGCTVGRGAPVLGRQLIDPRAFGGFGYGWASHLMLLGVVLRLPSGTGGGPADGPPFLGAARSTAREAPRCMVVIEVASLARRRLRVSVVGTSERSELTTETVGERIGGLEQEPARS